MRKRSKIFAVARSFSIKAALAQAEWILTAPPARPHIIRAAAAGMRLHRFVLPLELCKPQNRKRFAASWELGETREAILQLLAIQLRHHLPESPLPGRPVVQCIRFSSREPDAFADSFKMAIDCLCPPRARLHKGFPKRIPGVGLIADDRPVLCDVRQRWEFAPTGEGFGLIDVHEGEAA